MMSATERAVLLWINLVCARKDSTLSSALDQMRHFLWFYSQVMSNESECGDKLRQTIQSKPESIEEMGLGSSFLNRLSRVDEAALIRYLAEAKERKPN